jgi:hypothetical protein
MVDAGYSGTPLPKKLGLKDGQRVLFIDLPPEVGALREVRDFASCEEAGWDTLPEARDFDVIHGFTKARINLEHAVAFLRHGIKPDGMVWISWSKKASKVVTDMSEDVVREVLLPTGLVDVKVCAVDAVWSGLKLVIRKELR